MIFEDSRTYTAKSLRSDRQRIYSFSKTGTANNEYSNILQLFNSKMFFFLGCFVCHIMDNISKI